MHLHAEPVASFAILADEDPRWHPTGHDTECLGCRHRFDFPTVKLLALGPPDDSLFGRVLGAYRAARSTRKRPQARLAMKISLVQALYGQGFSPEKVRDLYTFIDWVLRLPLDLEFRFHETLQRFEEEHAMQYVTTAERIGIEKGRIEGIERGIEQGIEQGRHEGEVRLLTRQLERRFGPLPLWAASQLAEADLETLERWGERVLDAVSLVEVLS